MSNKNKDIGELLNQILIQIDKNNITYQLNKLLEKEGNANRKNKFLELFKWIAPILISSGIAIGTFLINHSISVNSSPLNYSIHLTKSIDKLSYSTNYFEKDYFTLSPFTNYTLTKNSGGKAKEMYLVKFSKANSQKLRVITATTNNTFSNPYKNNTKINILDYNLIWNKSTEQIFIFDSDLQSSTTTETVDTYFLILRGNNNNNEIITILQKFGGKIENYQDTTLTFNSLDIFVLHSWEQQADKTNLNNFQKVYEKTISEYKEVVNFTQKNLV